MTAKVHYDIIPRGICSGYVEAPLDEAAQEILRTWSFRVISLEENAQLRMQEGLDADVCQKGNWVREGVIYLPYSKERFLTKKSPVLAEARKAMLALRKGDEFYLDSQSYPKALSDAVAVPCDLDSIPVNRFGEEPITCFIFGKQAKKYGKFLWDRGIKEMPLCLYHQHTVDMHKKPFAHQLWFGSLNNSNSGLFGYYWPFDFFSNDRLRGIRTNGYSGLEL